MHLWFAAPLDQDRDSEVERLVCAAGDGRLGSQGRGRSGGGDVRGNGPHDLGCGRTGTLNVVLTGLVPAMLATGLVLALWLRAERPQVYARIGAEPPVLQEEEERVHS